ncbi:hypothetical protein KEM56_002068 [Ascosphaera pollenicola]|nr:hypothetical protein KEM56_002068 [Ascosphaera pollenicola]
MSSPEQARLSITKTPFIDLLNLVPQQSTIIAPPTNHDKAASKNILNTLAGDLEPLQRANSPSISSRPCFTVQKFEKKSSDLRNQGGPTIGGETGVIARSVDDDILPCTEQSKNSVSVEQTEIETSSDIGGTDKEEKVRVNVTEPYKQYEIFNVIRPPIRDDHAAVNKLTSNELERALPGHDRPTCATVPDVPISSNLYATEMLENVEVNLDMNTHPANEISMLAQSNDLELYVPKEDNGFLALQNRSFLNFVRDEDDLCAYNQWHWRASREQITLQEEFEKLRIEQQFGIHSIEGLVWPSPIEENIRRALPWWKAQDLKRQLKVKERYRSQRLRPSFRAGRAPQYGFYR